MIPGGFSSRLNLIYWIDREERRTQSRGPGDPGARLPQIPVGEVQIVRFSWLIFLAFFAAIASAGVVYRSVDAEGNASYSDRPDGENAESIFVAVQAPASGAPRAGADQESTTESTASAEETGEVQRERREPTPEERAEDRAKNCATARDRAERYAISHRLYRETPDGGREYLDDAALNDARVKAVADVQEWCG